MMKEDLLVNVEDIGERHDGSCLRDVAGESRHCPMRTYVINTTNMSGVG